MRDFRLGGSGPWVAEEARFTWASFDPDGDPVEVSLEYRREGVESRWIGVAVPSAGREWDPLAAGGWRDDRFEWNTSEMDEGDYEVRAIASDQASNEATEGRTFVVSPPVRLIVDRTPPRFELQPTGPDRYELTLEDALSEIRRLEVLADGRVVQSVRPVDGVCDSRRESFRVDLSEPIEQPSLRGTDAAGNRVDIPLEP